MPTLGRLPSVDPLYTGAVEDPQRWNRYAYALNSPLVYIDPDGRTGCTTTALVGGFSVGCPNGGGGSGSGGPSVSTPSPGQSPLLGSFDPSTDDYFSHMYYPGWSYGPGQNLGAPNPVEQAQPQLQAPGMAPSLRKEAKVQGRGRRLGPVLTGRPIARGPSACTRESLWTTESVYPWTSSGLPQTSRLRLPLLPLP